MPLGAREVLVAIRARDVTSRVLREIGNNFSVLGGLATVSGRKMFETGAALTAVGVGMGAVGAAGLSFFNNSINSFVEYSRQAALTKTQVDQLGVSVAEIADIGKRVANQIPAPFDQMQDALFDIFSSMDVNVEGAETLLTEFSRAAVAGQTDVRTAARSTIAIMNAYKIPVEKVTDVLDLQFRLVQKGVITYEEFATTIGRSIPAARSAGQTFNTLAGMMTFMTRNGLSAAMASTSAARAMELFAKPDVVAALEDIGVKVKDSEGNFRQLDDIVRQLAINEGWAKLAAPERKKMFQDIFGTGTIQARRFFDLAIPNFQEFSNLTDEMRDSAGSLGVAYETMFSEPAMKAQLLKNKYEILRVEIGEKLLPVKIKLIETVTKLIDWWNGLSESTKTLAVRFAAGTAAFLTMGGIALTLVGTFMMLAGALGGIGVAFAVLIGVPIIFAGVAAAAVAAFKIFGGGMKGIIAAVAAATAAFLALGAVWLTIGAITGGVAIATIVPIMAIAAAAILVALIIWKNWDRVVDVFNTVVDAIKGVWEWFTNLSLAGKLLVGILLAITAPFVLIIAGVIALIKNFSTIIDVIKGVWQWFNNLHMVGKIIVGIFVAIAAPMVAVVAAGVAIVKNWGTIVEWAGNLVDAAKAAFEWFMSLSTIFKILVGVVGLVVAPFATAVAIVIALGVAIAKNWDTIKNATIAVWSIVVDAVDTAWSLLKTFWNWITNVDVDVWGTIKDAAVTTFNTIKAVIEATVGFVTDSWNRLVSVSMIVWNALGAAVSAAGSVILGALQTVWGWLTIAYNWFVDNFGQNFADIWNTISDEVGDVANELAETFRAVVDVHKKFVENVGEGADFLLDKIKFAWGAITDFTGQLWKGFQFAWDRIKPILEFFGKFAIAKLMPLVIFLKEVVVSVFGALAAGIGRARDLIVDILSTLVIIFKFTWARISNFVTTAIDIIGSIIEAGVKVIVSLWENFGSLLLTPIKIVWDVISATFIAGVKVVSNVIQFFLNLIQGDWGEAWQNIVDVFSAIWDHFVAMIKAGIESAIFLFKSLPGAILGFLGDLVGILFDLGVDIVTGLINGMKDFLPEIGKFILQIGPMILLLLEDAGMLLYTVGKALIEGLISGAKAVWDSIFQFVSDTVSNIIDAFKSFFGISSPSTVMAEIGMDIIRGLLGGVIAAWEAVVSWFSERKDKVLEILGDVATWLVEKGKGIINGLLTGIKWLWDNSLFGWFSERKQKFLEFFSGVATWLLEKGKDLLRGLFTGIKWLWDNSLFGWFSERKQKFLDFFANAPSWLVEKGKDVLRGAWNGIKAVWDISIAGFFTGSDGGGGIATRFKNFFTNAGTWLVSAGKNIINGLKNGIKAVVDGISDWIGDRVDDIIDAFKSFFGISSPSTVMKEVGKNFILGFMEGIVMQAKNIPALVSKIGLSAADLMMHLFGDLTTGTLGMEFFDSAPKGSIQQMAKAMAAARGWTGVQWSALQKLVQAESGWNPNAQNPTSTAYGLFQFLNSTWAGTGISKTSNPLQQIQAGLSYIASRYGNPLNAWNFWNSNSPHWYAKGAWNVPTTGLAGLHAGEMVIPKTFAGELRSAMGGSGRGASFNFYGDVTFGSDMNTATNDLDFWSRIQHSGV